MEKVAKLRGRRKCWYVNRFKSSKIQNGSLVNLVWRSLRNTGLFVESHTGGAHWIANIANAIFITVTMTQAIELYQSRHGSIRLFECFSVFSFCSMGIIKLFSLRVDGKQWRLLLNEAIVLEGKELKEEQYPSTVEYESDEESSFVVSKYIGQYTRSFQSTFTLLTRVYSFTAIVFIVSPFVQCALWKLKGQKIVDYPHILPTWAPLAELNVVGYVLTVLLEGIASVYCVIVHIAFDLSIVGMMMFVRGQFSLLHAKCEQIGGCGNITYPSKTRDERAHFRIKNCHRINITIVNLVKQLNQLTKTILGVYFWLATTTLCSVAVQLKSDLRTTQLISLLQYMGATLTQLYIYCKYGDAVFNESTAGVGRGPHGSAWWCLSPRIRKELVLLMMGMSRRCQLFAGPFFSLNLPSFIQIVRTAYSYYAVLRSNSR